MIDEDLLQELSAKLEGELFFDKTTKILYATDASAYRQIPLAVALPKTEEDIKLLIEFANFHKTSLIPRAAGTSLAGQVVGQGIVVDISKYFNKILDLNVQENSVTVQPGVVRDELNHYLQPHGLFFGPETSTANRAMLGGMVGNNSCGTHSPIYQSTREHTLEIKGFLSDGSKVHFKNLSKNDFFYKVNMGKNQINSCLEFKIYHRLYTDLIRQENQNEIRNHFPKPEISRRNTGYALDMLLGLYPFNEQGDDFNLCKLICGSEGTLMFITEIKLNLVPRPPQSIGLLCIHCHSVDEALRANIIAMQYKPAASELMDHYILDCTKNNKLYAQNRFFVKGEPEAILVVEFAKDSREAIDDVVKALVLALQAQNLGYHFPTVYNEQANKVWNLRKAGLGLLSNMVGDEKPAPVIEDTAVTIEDLPNYIVEFNQILKKHNRFAVHYAHAGSGELHLRPILNLKTKKGHQEFRAIAEDVADLVKKYRGSLSGEHGDGRLRAEFIKKMVGEKNYILMQNIKKLFDPNNIFNPNKIVDAPPMDTQLRYEAGQETRVFDTILDFSDNQGILRTAEMCNGSGDCRKTEISGGTMCPSYMATRNEKETTRARANILREILTRSDKDNPFDSEEIKEIMDLCLSCKGCKSECPSNVDVGKMKAEFLYQYYKKNGVPRRTKLIANYNKYNRLASKLPFLYNWITQTKWTANLFKSNLGFAKERSLPRLSKKSLVRWMKKHIEKQVKPTEINTKILYLFIDEFTNYNDFEIGKKTFLLLKQLGYTIYLLPHEESGRAFLSKGLLKQAKAIAQKNVNIFKGKITEETPLVGIEPSAILSFRDEYIDLLRGQAKKDAQIVAQNTFTIEEFLANEIEKGNIKPEHFTTKPRVISLHGHCQQKTISSLEPSQKILSLPKHYQVTVIPSGCCGMAGSFGYEKEHYDISMKIGELVLFPTVRSLSEDVEVVASGTSCRHQIKDGTQRLAKHPVEILFDALK